MKIKIDKNIYNNLNQIFKETSQYLFNNIIKLTKNRYKL